MEGATCAVASQQHNYKNHLPEKYCANAYTEPQFQWNVELFVHCSVSEGVAYPTIIIDNILSDLSLGLADVIFSTQKKTVNWTK